MSADATLRDALRYFKPAPSSQATYEHIRRAAKAWLEQDGRPNPGALLGVTEVAAHLGVKKNTVIIWRRRHADFPKPIVVLAGGPVWWAPDVDEWAEKRRSK